MVDKIYTGAVKHIEATLVSYTEDDLEKLLGKLYNWRENESNKYQDYDLYIKDQHGELVFGSRF